MKNPLRHGWNMLRMAVLRLRHPSAVSTGWIQSFEHLRVEIRHGGRLTMGAFNQNREKLYLGVDGGEIRIGSHCFFNINCSVTGMDRIEIGDYCKFGNNVVIVDHDHNYHRTDISEPEFVSSPIEIGNNVWCGANVTILRGTIIGDHCVIGAGAVVRGTYAPGSRIVGMPGGRVQDLEQGR